MSEQESVVMDTNQEKEPMDGEAKAVRADEAKDIAPANLANYAGLKRNSQEGVWLHVLDVDTQSFTGISILLRGMDSDEYQALDREMQRRFMKRAGQRNRKKTQGMRGVRRDTELTDEELQEAEENDLRKLIACTVKWQTDGAGEVILIGQESLECNEVNARRVYEEYPWIKEQVQDHVHARENFF